MKTSPESYHLMRAGQPLERQHKGLKCRPLGEIIALLNTLVKAKRSLERR